MLSTGFLPGIFFRGGGKIYCYANFYYSSIVFGPNFGEGQKLSEGGKTALGGRGEKAESQSIKLHTVRTRNNAT